MDGEKLIVYQVRKKTDADYAFIRQGRPGNPDKRSFFPMNFCPAATVIMPLGFTERLNAQNPEALEELRGKLRQQKISGTVQIRRSLGSPGAGKSDALKMNLKSGAVTERRGFRVLLRNLEL